MKKTSLPPASLGIVSVTMPHWTMNGVRAWYNETLRHARTTNGVQYGEGTNEICVLYPKNYSGLTYEFLSAGCMVQVQHERWSRYV